MKDAESKLSRSVETLPRILIRLGKVRSTLRVGSCQAKRGVAVNGYLCDLAGYKDLGTLEGGSLECGGAAKVIRDIRLDW